MAIDYLDKTGAKHRADKLKEWSNGKFVTTNTAQTITGAKTFNAPANKNGVELATITFKTSNGGQLIVGKEGANSGTMLRFDQVAGTPRLYFRASTTHGAMVWSQPEKGATLYFDLTNSAGVSTRTTLGARNGTIARTSDIGNGTITIKKNGTSVGSFTTNQSGNKEIDLTLNEYVTKNSDQSITSKKTFTDTVNFNGTVYYQGNEIANKPYFDIRCDSLEYSLNNKLDGTVLKDMTKANTDGFYCFGYDYHSKLTHYKGLTGFLGHGNAHTKGGMVSDNNTTFVGFGKAGGYPWFGLTTYNRDYSDGVDAQLVESYGIMVRKGDVAEHSSAYILDGGASTDKETRLVTADELESKANKTHTHAISDVTNLQTTLNNKQNKIEYPCSFDGSGSNYVKLLRDGTTNYYVYIQRGNVTYQGSTTQYPSVNVTFPRSFSGAPTVIVTFSPTSNSTGTYEALKVTNVTSTGFFVNTRMSANISAGYFRVNWIAIYTV